jgi:hypothetical protein
MTLEPDSTTPRKAIPKRVRFEVLRRDNYTCRYCHATDAPLTIDHVLPAVLGGTDDPSNLVAACKDCNAGKSSSNPDATTVAQVGEDALRWAAAIKQAAAEMSEAGNAGAHYLQPIVSAWDDNNQMYRWSRARLPQDWTETVERWRKAGLPSEMVVEAIGIAMRNKQAYDVWRYAAGICWTRIKEIQQRASEIVAGAR